MRKQTQSQVSLSLHSLDWIIVLKYREWREQMARSCLTLSIWRFFPSSGRSVDDMTCPVSIAEGLSEASRWRVWCWRGGGGATPYVFCVSYPPVLVCVGSQRDHSPVTSDAWHWRESRDGDDCFLVPHGIKQCFALNFFFFYGNLKTHVLLSTTISRYENPLRLPADMTHLQLHKYFQVQLSYSSNSHAEALPVSNKVLSFCSWCQTFVTLDAAPLTVTDKSARIGLSCSLGEIKRNTMTLHPHSTCSHA